MLKSIYARTFLLMLVTVLVVQGISLLAPAERTPPTIAVRLEDIAWQLVPRGEGRPPTFGRDPRGAPGDMPPPDGGPTLGFGPDDGAPTGALPPPMGGNFPGPGLSVRTAAAEPPAPALPSAPDLKSALASLLQASPDDIRFFADSEISPLRGAFLAGLRLADGRWRVVEREPPGGTPLLLRAGKIFALESVALLPLAWLFARTLSAPISRFAEAARSVGQDGGVTPLPREGPAEVQAAVDAFNAMQARLSLLIQERTRMVGAIAHDLRTPLTRLAFRLDDLPAPLNAKVHADIDEMKSMISAALEFIRDRSLTLPRERLDLRLLVERVVNDLADLGHDVVLQAGGPVTVEAVPLAMRRLVSNLFENALKYGQRARARLVVDTTHCTLEIDDDGPGIHESLQEQVFEPFFRVEGSRNRDTGGIGLGLSAVRAIALEHSGEVRLGNRKDGGLRVSVALPLAKA